MTLNNFFAITDVSDHNHYYIAVYKNGELRAEKAFAIWNYNAPNYDGAIYSKNQKSEIKANKENVKKYGDCNISKIFFCGSTINISLTID